MNKIKHLYIILLSVLFINNNFVSMGKPNYIATEQESQLLSLPAELMTNIVNETVVQQLKETINEWNDIFQDPKINLQNIALVSLQFKDVLNVALKLPSLKNYLNQLVKDLKSKRFDELFEDLRHQSIEQYKGLPKDKLNQALTKILNKAAISKEGFKVVMQLILAGANVNTTDNSGNTALMEASKKDYKDIVEMLIKTGANVNATANDGNTALMWASKNGYKDVLEILINAGADVNAKTIYGFTALIWSSRNGHKDIVEMLIKAGANVNAKTIYGNTALIEASKNGHKDIVKILIKEC
ncbi:ankyrin repeat domain-containing protein [Candidatus Babela massiliensis]|uniref:Ankyrin repeats containing protein n=1 Tax=Candidatus Babela massiliensis TaxID=673862 RepID=V6DI54_9BACT|nr:ankyrin repeat domain-containing protein [Candidatus Babela massiliensis]CDK30211.1 Ankyrin repeats containing protein [Candidatus Babela massiliensis]